MDIHIHGKPANIARSHCNPLFGFKVVDFGANRNRYGTSY